MKRQLVSSAEAVPAIKQHTKPCGDCPWARTSINGWLGSDTKENWAAAAHGESRMDCHTITVPSLSGTTPAQCAGAAIYRGNICKRPRDASLLVLPANRERVFAHRGEFFDHHSKAPSKLGEEGDDS